MHTPPDLGKYDGGQWWCGVQDRAFGCSIKGVLEIHFGSFQIRSQSAMQTLSFCSNPSVFIFTLMEPIIGINAIRLAQEVSKLPDGSFTIGFFQYNRTKGKALSELRVLENCKTRAQLPQEQWGVESDNYFLFTDQKGEPKTCYRVLVRFMGFPQDGFKLRKVNWFN